MTKKFWRSEFWTSKSDSTGPGETSGASDRLASRWGISRSKRPINWIMRQKKLNEEMNAQTQNMQGRQSMESVANTEYNQYMRDRQHVEYEENIENGETEIEEQKAIRDRRDRIDSLLNDMSPDDLSKVHRFCLGRVQPEGVTTQDRAMQTKSLSKLSDSKQSNLLDIPRRYFPATFETELGDPQKLSREDTIELLATSVALDKKVAILYDLDYTLVDPRSSSTFKKEWIDALEIFQELKAKIGVMTGSGIEDIQGYFDRSGKGHKVAPKVHMFGERGDVYKGPLSNGKKVLSHEELRKYVPLVEGIYKDIIDEIKRNDVLTGYKTKKLIPQEIGIKINSLGLSILNQGAKFFLENHPEMQLSKNTAIDVNDKNRAPEVLMQEMRNIISSVLKKYPDFEQEERLGFFIRLKQSVAGRKLDKGAALQNLVDAYKLESVFTIGDGLVDVDAEKQAQQLLDINRFIDTYVEERPKRKIEFFDRFSRSIESFKASETGKASETRVHELNPKDDKVKKQMEAQIDVNEALLKINKRALKRSGMIGVQRPEDIVGSPEVAKKSMYMATGIEDIAHLSYEIALRAREIRSQHAS